MHWDPLPPSHALAHVAYMVEGDRGWEVYGRQGKRGQEAGFPRWQEAGETGKITQHCTIFYNRKNAKG